MRWQGWLVDGSRWPGGVSPWMIVCVVAMVGRTMAANIKNQHDAGNI